MLHQPSKISHTTHSVPDLSAAQLPKRENSLSGIPTLVLPAINEEVLLPLVKEMLELPVDDLTLTRVGGVGAKGKSGAQIFLVSDMTGTPFVLKLFKDLEEYSSELSSHAMLSDLSLSWFTVPSLIDLKIIECDGKAWGGLLMTAAAGKPLDDRLKAFVNAETDDQRGVARGKLEAGLTRAARAMAELHREKIGERPSEAYFDYQRDEMHEAMDRLLRNPTAMKFTGCSHGEIKDRVEGVFEAFKGNPGVSSYCHGDAGLGNIFYQRNTVTFIDLETFRYSFDEAGRPVGSAARDVVNMSVKLGYYGQQFGLDDTTIAELQGHFRREYDKVKPHELTQEAERFFATRILLAKLGKNDPSIDIHARLLFELLGIDRCPLH